MPEEETHTTKSRRTVGGGQSALSRRAPIGIARRASPILKHPADAAGIQAQYRELFEMADRSREGESRAAAASSKACSIVSESLGLFLPYIAGPRSAQWKLRETVYATSDRCAGFGI